MEPRIQYAKTSDGLNIAYATLGQGPAFVYMPIIPFCHVQLQWQIPEWRAWCEHLARRRTVVWYDSRGTGLSDRDITELPPEATLLDLEAVLGGLDNGPVTLMGIQGSLFALITYAVHNSDRVSHFIVWSSTASAAEYRHTSRAQALTALREVDWELYTQNIALAAHGWSAPQESDPMAAMIRESVTQEVAVAFMRDGADLDVSELLPNVKSPALVLHRRQAPWPQLDSIQRLAAAIPGARFSLLEGSAIAPFLGNTGDVLRAIDEFLGDAEEAPAAGVHGDTHTVLFTDMASSTALAQRLGDAAAQRVRRAHDSIVRASLSASGGSEIKHTGDGIMASFTSASSALECAIAIQRGVARHKEEHPDTPLGVYIGLNAGEPVAEGDPEGRIDLFGTSINLAKRICDHAQPGQILASDVVRQLSAGKDFLFSDVGETELRGFEDPVKLWEVRWEEQR